MKCLRNGYFHIELLLIYDKSVAMPITIVSKLREKLDSLEGTYYHYDEYTYFDFDFEMPVKEKTSLKFHKPRAYNSDDNNSLASYYGHEFKNNEEVYADFIYRASYLAKKNDEEYVRRQKKFGIIRG